MRGINFKNILFILKKELKTYFDSPIAYIVLIVFLLIWEFLFFKNVFLVGEASLRILFNFLPWLFLLLIPAITMGSVAQEISEGTIEFLLTHPVREIELLIGKYLAAMVFTAIVLLFIFPIALSLSPFGDLDWGVIMGEYMGSMLMASVIISLGIFFSSLFPSQITSLLLTATGGFLLIIAGFEIVTASLPLFLAPLLDKLSILSHFRSMARGVIDLRDVWYFASGTIVFLSLAYLQFLKRRFGNNRSIYRPYRIGIALFIGIAILINIVGSRIPGRIDLTEGKIYTLTDATKKILANLDDVVNITLYASGKLPAQLQPVLRDTKDILRDYETFGKGNIILTYKNPDEKPYIAKEAISVGVRQVQFNVIGQEEFRLKQGFLGVSVSYGGKHEAIPFVRDTSELEYDLTSIIKKLTTKEKKTVRFLSGHGEKMLFTDYRLVSRELEKQFKVETFTIDDKTTSIPHDTAVLVIAGPSRKIDDKARKMIKEYLDQGGSALFLIDTVQINPGMLYVTPVKESFSDFLKAYGIKVRTDIVYDLRSNETVNVGGGFISFLVPYPFWPRVIGNPRNPVTARIKSMVIPWGSTIDIDEKKVKDEGIETTPLFTTTRFGGIQEGSFSIGPRERPSAENLQVRPIAISAIRHRSNSRKITRFIVVGDSDFLTDRFVQNIPENMAFALEAISWLSQEESLAGIKIKQKRERRLFFENKTQMALIKYGNIFLAFIVPAGYGAYRLIRRRNMQRMKYS